MQGLDLPNILVEIEKRGSSFDKVLTIPEQDDWMYNDGKPASCVAFVLEMYKEAGLFDPITTYQLSHVICWFILKLIKTLQITICTNLFICIKHKR